VNWSELYRYRREIQQRFPEVWDLKIVKKRLPILLEHIQDGDKILEIGAYDRKLEKRIKAHFPQAEYRSMDIDRSLHHDYYTLEDIEGKFDEILLFEVIEHLDFEEGMRLLQKIHELLASGGKLILSTPNMVHPVRYWEGGVAHRVPYYYAELGGLLLSRGFEVVNIYRVFNDAFFQYVMRVYLFSLVHRFLGIDFAKSILVVAKRS
jgi:SAM-dependent methyltransferase